MKPGQERQDKREDGRDDSRDDSQQRVVGVYDRPASADRKRGPWILIVLAALIAIAWAAYLGFSAG